MKSSLLTTTSALGLTPLTWVSFTLPGVGASWQSIGANFQMGFAATVAVAAKQGMGQYPNMSYTITPNNISYPCPAWMIPGQTIKLALSVATPQRSVDISGYYVVKSVAANGLSFVVNAPSASGGLGPAALTIPGKYTCDALGGGVVGTPAFTLITQCQKVVFKATAGTVVIAPNVDATGVAPYPTTLVSGQSPEQEYVHDAQPGSKFDIGDWSVMSSNSGNLAVKFI
jgi:hypothetical protein